VVFSHIYLNPYIWEHLRKCGLRSIALFPEIPFLERTIREEGRRVDGYVVEIERQRDWLVGRREIPEDSVAAIPPGFDAVLVQSARRSATKNTRPTIVFSGRLHKWKGVYELLEVFSLLAHDYPQWDLHFVGDGPARVGLHERVRDKGLQERVVFWGRRPHDQAVRIVAGAEVFVLPSYIEVFPISLLEAMALGVPAIATDVGGVKDYMIEDGVTGLLIPPKDPKALRRALARLASSPELRRSLGENGQELVKNLTFDKMVGSTTEFYAHVLSQD
jgi:glycosyltransferase involved in cell wall biosynthesis